MSPQKVIKIFLLSIINVSPLFMFFIVGVPVGTFSLHGTLLHRTLLHGHLLHGPSSLRELLSHKEGYSSTLYDETLTTGPDYGNLTNH